MKKFLFVCDFDGTMSTEDFYKKIMRKYMPEKESTRYLEFRAGKIQNIIFLNEIFNHISLDENLFNQDILNLSLDTHSKDLIEKVHILDGDFIILSAGCEYYIKKILDYHQINDITLYANEGIYRERGMYITPNSQSPFYSERYGIDKEKVVKHLKDRYDFMFYAGDSGPDFLASLHADIRFAKDRLIGLYEKSNISHIPFTSFADIIPQLENLLP